MRETIKKPAFTPAGVLSDLVEVQSGIRPSWVGMMMVMPGDGGGCHKEKYNKSGCPNSNSGTRTPGTFMEPP
jgi:hypothetical protein